jgi:hypothetical protein
MSKTTKQISFWGLQKAYRTNFILVSVSWDSVVGIATASGLKTEGSEFESRWGQEFSVLHIVQIGSGVHPASYPMGTGGSFPGGKAAGT